MYKIRFGKVSKLSFSLQVANFIVKNSQGAPVVNTNAQYADPFTGGSRYIPTSSEVPSIHPVKPPIASSSSSSVGPTYIPRTTYLKLEQANLAAILGNSSLLSFLKTHYLDSMVKVSWIYFLN